MSEGRIRIERRGHVLLVGLDRAAKRNAFDLPLWDALCRAYGELDRDDELRAGVPEAEAAAAARLLPDLQPLMASEDMQEGLRSFVERRPGRFRGR